MNSARVDIVDPFSGEVVDHCYGPTYSGQCPRLNQEGIPPCSGHRIVPLGAEPAAWLRWVPPTTRHCPLAWNEDIGDVEYP